MTSWTTKILAASILATASCSKKTAPAPSAAAALITEAKHHYRYNEGQQRMFATLIGISEKDTITKDDLKFCLECKPVTFTEDHYKFCSRIMLLLAESFSNPQKTPSFTSAENANLKNVFSNMSAAYLERSKTAEQELSERLNKIMQTSPSGSAAQPSR